MSDLGEFEGLFEPNERRLRPDGLPPTARPSPRLVRRVERVLESATSAQDVAEWVADFMERYAANFAHPCFDASADDGPVQGPECSLCGMLWPLCGHGKLSAWEPVARTPPLPSGAQPGHGVE